MNACSADDWTVSERVELRAFCRESLGTEQPFDAEIRAGRAADEIHAAAASMRADLLVMGSHGLTGIHKVFFGSTAERVLRETDIPVLVTPGDLQGQHGPATLASAVRRILVPIDLTGASAALVRLGAALGQAIDVPVLVAHAIEPLHVPARWQSRVPSLHLEARDRAEAAMHRVVEEAGGDAESMVLIGDAADAIINVANVRAAGLILMGLQQSGLGRVGVIAYRVLCRSQVPVLALPRAAAARLASEIAVPVPAVACSLMTSS